MNSSPSTTSSFDNRTQILNRAEGDDTPEVQTVPARRSRLQLALVWRRGLARTIDAVLANVVFNVLYTSAVAPFVALHFAIVAILAGAMHMLLEALLLRQWGYTPGKRLFGLKIISTRADGVPIPAMERSVRVWAYGFLFAIPGLSTLASLWAGWQMHQGETPLWDKACGTEVIHVDGEGLV